MYAERYGGSPQDELENSMKVIQLTYLLNKLQELHKDGSSAVKEHLHTAEVYLSQVDIIKCALQMQVVAVHQEVTNMANLGPEVEAQHRKFIQEAKEIGMRYIEQVQQGIAAHQFANPPGSFVPPFMNFNQK